MAKNERYDQTIEEMMEEHEAWQSDFEERRSAGIVRTDRDSDYEDVNIDSYLESEFDDVTKQVKQQEKESIAELIEVKDQIRGIPDLTEEGKEMVNETITLTKEQFAELLASIEENKKIQAIALEKSRSIDDLTTSDIAKIIKRDVVKAAENIKDSVKSYTVSVKDKVIDTYHKGMDKVKAGIDKSKEYVQSVKDKALSELDKAGKFFKYEVNKTMAIYHDKMEKTYSNLSKELDKKAEYLENVGKSVNKARTEIKNVFRALANKDRVEEKELSPAVLEKIEAYRNLAESYRDNAEYHKEKCDERLEQMEEIFPDKNKEMTMDEKIQDFAEKAKEENSLEMDKDTKEKDMGDMDI